MWFGVTDPKEALWRGWVPDPVTQQRVWQWDVQGWGRAFQAMGQKEQDGEWAYIFNGDSEKEIIEPNKLQE